MRSEAKRHEDPVVKTGVVSDCVRVDQEFMIPDASKFGEGVARVGHAPHDDRDASVVVLRWFVGEDDSIVRCNIGVDLSEGLGEGVEGVSVEDWAGVAVEPLCHRLHA